jgi:hypothetical protein
MLEGGKNSLLIVCSCYLSTEAKESEICIGLTPFRDEGETALESREPHPRRATHG